MGMSGAVGAAAGRAAARRAADRGGLPDRDGPGRRDGHPRRAGRRRRARRIINPGSVSRTSGQILAGGILVAALALVTEADAGPRAAQRDARAGPARLRRRAGLDAAEAPDIKERAGRPVRTGRRASAPSPFRDRARSCGCHTPRVEGRSERAGHTAGPPDTRTARRRGGGTQKAGAMRTRTSWARSARAGLLPHPHPCGMRRQRFLGHQGQAPRSPAARPVRRPARPWPATSWWPSRTTSGLQTVDNIIPAVNAEPSSDAMLDGAQRGVGRARHRQADRAEQVDRRRPQDLAQRGEGVRRGRGSGRRAQRRLGQGRRRRRQLLRERHARQHLRRGPQRRRLRRQREERRQPRALSSRPWRRARSTSCRSTSGR